MEVDKAAGKVVTDKGQTFYFHTKEVPGKPYLKPKWFSKEASGAIPIPEEYEIIVNSKTGLPIAKKKK